MTTIEKEEPLFSEILSRHDLELCRDVTTALQVNVGLACDLSCRHCHLEAGPERHEMMEREVMEAVVDCSRRFRFASIDLTGGSPELVPGLDYLLKALAPLTPRLIVRSNLMALGGERGGELCELYRELGVVVVGSLPSTNRAQTEAQRGSGVWEQMLTALRRLNSVGFGIEGSGLELALVSNPSGAFLPPGQQQAERKFRADLMRRHGISFNALHTFVNAPLGRFRSFLEGSGNLESYLARLREGFNPGTVAGLMCRRQLSVDWRGRLFDCDFHLAVGLPHAGEAAFVWELAQLPAPGTPIPAAEHCYACTAGSGFT